MYPNTIGKAGPTNWRRCVLSPGQGARDALRRGQSRGPHRSRRQPAPLPGLRCGARIARRASPPRRPTPLARSEGGGGAHPHVPLGFVLEAGKQRRSAEALSNGGGIGPVPGTGGEGGGGAGCCTTRLFYRKKARLPGPPQASKPPPPAPPGREARGLATGNIATKSSTAARDKLRAGGGARRRGKTERRAATGSQLLVPWCAVRSPRLLSAALPANGLKGQHRYWHYQHVY
jgi:hypothetical protein